MKSETKRHRQLKYVIHLIILVLIILAAILIMLQKSEDKPNLNKTVDNVNDELLTFARENNLSLDDWPKELLTMLEKNPEAKEFVLNYPIKKDVRPSIDLSAYTDCQDVPLLLQWDERWGYTEYGN